MLRLRNLSLNGAHVHVIIRVCTAPLIISHISSWSSTPRRTRTFPTCNVVGKALRIHPRLLSENLHQFYLFIFYSCTSFAFRSRSWHYSGNHSRQANQSNLHRPSPRLGSFKFMRPRPDGCPHWPCQGSEHASVIRTHGYWMALH